MVSASAVCVRIDTGFASRVSISMGVYGAPSTPSWEGAGVGHNMASVTKWEGKKGKKKKKEKKGRKKKKYMKNRRGRVLLFRKGIFKDILLERLLSKKD